MNKEYIFHIGLNKAGTISLAYGLESILKQPILHFTDSKIFKPNGQYSFISASSVFQNEFNNTKDIQLERYPFKGYIDIECFEKPEIYQFLFNKYSKSKFILTVRNKQDWLQSRAKHVLRNLDLLRVMNFETNFKTVNTQEWSEYYDTHINNVNSFFNIHDPKRLLVIYIPGGDTCEKIYNFLDVSSSEDDIKTFPKLNACNKRTVHVSTLI